MRHRERCKQGLSFRWDMVFVTIVLFLYVTLPMDFAHAFDGQRKGFILGGGPKSRERCSQNQAPAENGQRAGFPRRIALAVDAVSLRRGHSAQLR